MARPRAQTTLLIGGSNGTKTLAAILCDKTKKNNENHVVRIATRSSTTFLNDDGSPRSWRCEEKRHISDLVAADFLPHRILTHVGTPDSVFVYGANDSNGAVGPSIEGVDGDDDELSPLELAISGVGTRDAGGVADVIILACPVSAHLDLLGRLAKALHRLDARGLLGDASRPPLLIGTLYGAGGFDWMARVAFYRSRPRGFKEWNRPLGLFALKAFPYLCKSLEKGKVTLHGRFPDLQVAVTPSDASTRMHARVVLDRVLQNETTGKRIEFLGLSAREKFGGDGTVAEEEMVLDGDSAVANGGSGLVSVGNSARNAVMIAARTGGKDAAAAAGASIPPAVSSSGGNSSSRNGAPGPAAMDLLLTTALSDRADPFNACGFLTCSLNATNQILHPCILVALFRDPANPERSDVDGTIPWNPRTEATVLPRFYGDGARKAEAGELITAIAGGEMYFVIDALERLVCPRGYDPVSALHGGEPVGRKIMNMLGNSPHELGERSGLTRAAMDREWAESHRGSRKRSDAENAAGDKSDGSSVGNRPGLIHRESLLAWAMSYGLSHNSRLGAVLSPCIVDESSKRPDGSVLIRPNPRTRFFTDDVQHGMCVYLGLAELLGFDLERDMPKTLYVVRRLQGWMGKEYVVPANKTGVVSTSRPVSDARDVAETSAPQAFGVRTVRDLRRFLDLDVFGERRARAAEGRLDGSGVVSRL